MIYLLVLLLTFFLSIILTWLIKKIALKWQIVDWPDWERKIHKVPIPLLGGVAVFLSFAIVLLISSFFTNFIIKDFILTKHVLGLILAGLVIIIGGTLDDKYNLKPRTQFLFPLLAAIIIIISGISINYIINPFGGTISFRNWDLILFWWQGLPYRLTLLADLFTLLWLLGMMYTTKLLDGLDGLVSGITVIGSLIIFAIAMSKEVAQYNTALVALILAGSFLGFLLFNFHPAKIFLGESGSLFAGLMLGVLAIISGSKVATTLLIMGIPILDVIWVIGRRLFNKKAVSLADRKHLHFRLLDIGLSQRQAVIFMYILTALFGSAALFLQTFGKLVAFLILIIVMLILGASLVIMYKYGNIKNPKEIKQ